MERSTPTADLRCAYTGTYPDQPPENLDCGLRRLEGLVQATFGDTPPLDLIVDYVPGANSARLAWIRYSASYIPLRFAFSGSPFRDESHRSRSLATTIGTIGHELVHAYAATGAIGGFESERAEERAAYAFQNCATVMVSGIQFAAIPKKGKLSGAEDDVSWQASNDVDAMTAEAVDSITRQPSDKDRADAVLAVCRRLFGA